MELTIPLLLMRPIKVHGGPGDLGRVSAHGHLAAHEVPDKGWQADDAVGVAQCRTEGKEQGQVTGVHLIPLDQQREMKRPRLDSRLGI